jgi:transglutaminase-like putative cysteine protease
VRRALVLLLAGCSTPAASPAPPAQAAAPPASAPAPASELDGLVELAKHGPDQKEYPQADAVIALARDEITLGADRTVVEHQHTIVRILDAQRGKEKFADLHIPYDTTRETLTLQIARTVNADGTVHVASPDEITDILPPQLEGATTYSGVRERVVSFPGVDKGSVIELEYTRVTQATADAALGGEAPLATWDPIRSRVVRITAPKDAVVKLSVQGMTLEPVESSDATTRSYTFTEENLPDRHPEHGSPPDAAVLPRLVYSFLPDWKAALARVADRYLDAAVPAAIPAPVQALADKLVADAKTPFAMAEAIYRFVAHDVRTIDLPLGWAGYAPNPPDVVLANRYGDDRDKVGLFLALCAAAGIPGQPLLVRTEKVPVVAAVPTVAQFNRMIARVTIDGAERWVDPSDENGQFGVAFVGQDNQVLALARGGGELVHRPALDPETSVARVAAAFALSDKGDLEADYRYDLTGWFADRASETLRPLKGENLARWFQEAAARLAASAIDKAHEVGDLTSVYGAIRIRHTVTVPAYAPAQGSFRVFELPRSTLGFAVEKPPAGLTKRKYPLATGTPRTIIEELTLSVPAGWRVAYVPPELTGAAEGVRYRTSCRSEDRRVLCRGELSFTSLQLSAEQYPAFHDAMAKLQDYGQQIVLLTR